MNLNRNPNPNPNEDLPWLLPPGAPVSFTVLGAADAYAPVKNALADAAKKAAAGQSPGAASSAEFLVYALNAKLLRLAGAQVSKGAPNPTPNPNPYHNPNPNPSPNPNPATPARACLPSWTR